MKKARFIAKARREFLAEVTYYTEAQPGLGARFSAAVEEAAARALAFPSQGRRQYRTLVASFSKLFHSPCSIGLTTMALLYSQFHTMRGTLPIGWTEHTSASPAVNRALRDKAAQRRLLRWAS